MQWIKLCWSHHFPRLANSLVFVQVCVLGWLLFLHFVHNSVNGKAEAGHSGQVTNSDVKFQCFVPHMLRSTAALTADCCLTQQLCTMKEPCSNLDLLIAKSQKKFWPTLLLLLQTRYLDLVKNVFIKSKGTVRLTYEVKPVS